MSGGSLRVTATLAAREALRPPLTMAPSSLSKVKKGRSTSSINKTTHSLSSSTNSTTTDAVLHQIQLLTSQLPPAAPANSSLNPLADLIEIFTNIPLHLTASASAPPPTQLQLQQNRQQTHSALHSIKAIFESLISHGRLHGKLKQSSKKGKLTRGGQVQEDDTVEKVKRWLNDRWAEFLSKATKVVQGHWDPTVRVSRRSLSRSQSTSADLYPETALGPLGAHVAPPSRIVVPHFAAPLPASSIPLFHFRLHRPRDTRPAQPPRRRDRRRRDETRDQGRVDEILESGR